MESVMTPSPPISLREPNNLSSAENESNLYNQAKPNPTLTKQRSGHLNLYASSFNSPLVFVDPDGRSPIKVVKVVWDYQTAVRRGTNAVNSSNPGSGLLYAGAALLTFTPLWPVGVFLSGWAYAFEDRNKDMQAEPARRSLARELNMDAYIVRRLRAHAHANEASRLSYSESQRSRIEDVRAKILKLGQMADRSLLTGAACDVGTDCRTSEVKIDGLSFGIVRSAWLEHSGRQQLNDLFQSLEIEITNGVVEEEYGPQLPRCSPPPTSVEIRGLEFANVTGRTQSSMNPSFTLSLEE